MGATQGQGFRVSPRGWVSLPHPGHHPSSHSIPQGTSAGRPTSFAFFPVTTAIQHCANFLGLTLPPGAVIPRAVPRILLVLQKELSLSQVL